MLGYRGCTAFQTEFTSNRGSSIKLYCKAVWCLYNVVWKCCLNRFLIRCCTALTNSVSDHQVTTVARQLFGTGPPIGALHFNWHVRLELDRIHLLAPYVLSFSLFPHVRVLNVCCRSECCLSFSPSFSLFLPFSTSHIVDCMFACMFTVCVYAAYSTGVCCTRRIYNQPTTKTLLYTFVADRLKKSSYIRFNHQKFDSVSSIPSMSS